jgi:hypothetical protein
VNFVAHIAIGLEVSGNDADSELLVGTALPDFAAMARLRLVPVDGIVGTGIRLHHLTDGVFHRHEWFLDLERDMHTALVADGMPRGGALACSHVGVELVLDGALLHEPWTADAVADVYAAIGDPTDEVVAAVEPARREQWRRHLSGVALHLDPFAYCDPSVVAERLHRITSSRPRLAFDDEHIGTLARHLARVQPEIAAAAGTVIQQVAGTLRRARRALGNT